MSYAGFLRLEGVDTAVAAGIYTFVYFSLVQRISFPAGSIGASASYDRGRFGLTSLSLML